MSSRQNPLRLSSCHYRLSLFGGPYRFPVFCATIAFGGPIPLHISEKVLLQYYSDLQQI